MALSATLGNAGFTAERLAAQAMVSLEQVQGNWTINRIDLQLDAKVPGIDAAKFEELAQDAKKNCPVSRLLNAQIELKASLQG